MAIIYLDSSDNFYLFRTKFNRRSDDVGDLDFLQTTADSDLVKAINSLVGELDETYGGIPLYDRYGVLLNPP